MAGLLRFCTFLSEGHRFLGRKIDHNEAIRACLARIMYRLVLVVGKQGVVIAWRGYESNVPSKFGPRLTHEQDWGSEALAASLSQLPKDRHVVDILCECDLGYHHK